MFPVLEHLCRETRSLSPIRASHARFFLFSESFQLPGLVTAYSFWIWILRVIVKVIFLNVIHEIQQKANGDSSHLYSFSLGWIWFFLHWRIRKKKILHLFHWESKPNKNLLKKSISGWQDTLTNMWKICLLISNKLCIHPNLFYFSH